MLTQVEARSIAASAIANGWLRPPPAKVRSYARPMRVIMARTQEDRKQLDRISEKQPHRKEAMRILRVVAKHYHCVPGTLLKYNRTERYSWARHVIFTLCHEVLELSLSEIGRIFMRAPKSTLNATRCVRSRREIDPRFEVEYAMLKTAVSKMVGTDSTPSPISPRDVRDRVESVPTLR